MGTAQSPGILEQAGSTIHSPLALHSETIWFVDMSHGTFTCTCLSSARRRFLLENPHSTEEKKIRKPPSYYKTENTIFKSYNISTWKWPIIFWFSFAFHSPFLTSFPTDIYICPHTHILPLIRGRNLTTDTPWMHTNFLFFLCIIYVQFIPLFWLIFYLSSWVTILILGALEVEWPGLWSVGQKRNC